MYKTTIGNTPMIKITYEDGGKLKEIFAKLEYFNLTGSIKDRVAYYILTKSKKDGILKSDMPIVEVTSGNTGISLSALGRYFNHEVYIFMPDWVSVERVKILKSFGANVILVSKEDGGFLKCLELAKKFAKDNNGFLVNQFANKYNYLAHYETTAKEIIKQLPKKPWCFISGVGTGGTLMGVGKRLKQKYKNLKIIAIEPEKMPMLTNSKTDKINETNFDEKINTTNFNEEINAFHFNKEINAPHKIEGIGDEFIPDLIDEKSIDEIFLINDDDAINMSRKLAKELGLGVGISSGANFIGGILASRSIEKNESVEINESTKKSESNEKNRNIENKKSIVTVFADDNKKYLSTDLSKEIDNNNSFISNSIKLLKYEVV